MEPTFTILVAFAALAWSLRELIIGFRHGVMPSLRSRLRACSGG